MSCASCGAANRAGVKFCTACGSALAATCPHCGSQGETGRFCGECGGILAPAGMAADPAGQPTGTAAIPAQTAEPVSERRVVSVLFADLVGFTPLAETRDPEAVRELLSAYFERTREVIERYGGTVEKFIGDAVCAVWGVPVVREDDAERAVRAGLDLVSTIAALREEVGADELQIRVGLTTGRVAVTLGASAEGMVAGDAVNTAAGVQAAASPGQVWVDDKTRSLTSAGLEYEPVGSHLLKGKSEPLDLHRAVRTTATVSGDLRVDGLEAPFVGRDRQLRMVKELFHVTAEERHAQLVVVAGEPGIGKTRLAWEFEKYVDAITSHSTHWLRGRCLSYGQGVAGHVMAEMVRSLLRVADSDDRAQVQEALDERLQRHVRDDAIRALLLPRLQSLLGLADHAYEQADLFSSMRSFLEELTADGSLVTLVIEDLQWADDAFLDFIDHLLEAARSPIMILALARSELTTRRPMLASGRRTTMVFLEPLPDAAMAQLLDGLVTDLPAGLRDDLIRRADGIPLYAVETVRSLIDRDVVVPAGGRYVVDHAAIATLDMAQLAPPASLHALLAARLDALTPDERRVVQDGSVLGLTFTHAGIAALSPASIDLDGTLSSLRRKEILAFDTDPRSPERGQFRFVQALLRGVAYETLSRRDRKARHIAVAEHLQSLPDPDAIAAVLAAHYLDAAAAVPEDDDVDALRARAVDFLDRAARHAVDIGAPLDAMTHFAQVFAMGAPAAVLVRSAARAVRLAMATGSRSADAREWLEIAMAAAEEAGDEEGVLELKLCRGSILSIGGGGQLHEGIRELREVFEACIGVASRVRLTSISAEHLAVAASWVSDVALVQDVVVRALADIEQFGDEAAFGRLLHALGCWFVTAGYRRITPILLRAGVERNAPRTFELSVAQTNLSLMIRNDRPVEAIAVARSAIETAEAIGAGTVSPRSVLLVALVNSGRWAEAAECV